MTSAFMQRKFGDRVVAIPSPITTPRESKTPMKYDQGYTTIHPTDFHANINPIH